MTAKKSQMSNEAKLALLPSAVQDTIKEKAHMTDETPAVGETTPTVEEAPQAETPTVAKPAKSKLTWKEKLALLPEEEAKAIRAKAAEASRISKAKKRGTTPEQAAVTRLETKLAKADEDLATLKELKADLTAQLKEAKKALTAAENAETPTTGSSVTSGTADLD